MSMHHALSKLSLVLMTASLLSMGSLPVAAANETAPIAGFAQSFLLGTRLANAKVTVLETGQEFYTDKVGHFGPFDYPVGKPITLQLEKWSYKTTRTSTVIVPPGGQTGPFENITFQVPSIITYYLLANIVGATIDDNSCHVTATVTAYHKLLHDIPQGMPGATVTIKPAVDENPFYFDLYKSGPFKGKTNPFTRKLAKTSEDGGVAFFNLPPSDKPYVMTAKKDGVKFTETLFMCEKGAFINISPPKGPMEMKEIKYL